MAINTENGVSVYCPSPPQERATQPLYRAARHLIARYSETRHVLDLGCSDLVASLDLAHAGFTVYGVDLARSALRIARESAPQARLALASLTELPIRDTAGKIDGVFLLDVLEHLPKGDAVGLLRTLSERLPHRPLSVVVTMPVISPFSVNTLKEGLRMALAGRRPSTGLFDRTHHILTNSAGHKAIFTQAGYRVVEEGYTDGQGVVGIAYPAGSTPTPVARRMSLASAVVEFSVRTAIPRLLAPLGRETTEAVVRRLTEYQGMYVIQP